MTYTIHGQELMESSSCLEMCKWRVRTAKGMIMEYENDKGDEQGEREHLFSVVDIVTCLVEWLFNAPTRNLLIQKKFKGLVSFSLLSFLKSKAFKNIRGSALLGMRKLYFAGNVLRQQRWGDTGSLLHSLLENAGVGLRDLRTNPLPVLLAVFLFPLPCTMYYRV